MTYSLNYLIPRRKKLELRAFIGYLVGYESTNIFRIWIPNQKKVIVTRDVTFDELKIYNPADINQAIQLQEYSKTPLEVIQIDPLPTKSLIEDLDTTDSETDISDLETKTSSTTSAAFQDSRKGQAVGKNHTIEKEKFPTQMPTPEQTPDPFSDTSSLSSVAQDEEDLAEKPPDPGEIETQRPVLTQEVIGDIDVSNIIEGPRIRKPSTKRQDVYFSDLAMLERLLGYHAAFHAGVKFESQQLHRDQLPKPPQN